MRKDGLKAQLGYASIAEDKPLVKTLTTEAIKAWGFTKAQVKLVTERSVKVLKARKGPTAQAPTPRKASKPTTTKPKATKPKARVNPWDAKPGTTDREALASFLEGDDAVSIVVKIGRRNCEAILGSPFVNKGGTERACLFVESTGKGANAVRGGYTTVRLHGGDLPEEATLYISPEGDGEGGASVKVKFPATSVAK